MEYLLSIILCGFTILLSFKIYKHKLNKKINKIEDEVRNEIYQNEKEKIVVQVRNDMEKLTLEKKSLQKEIDEKLSFNTSLLKIREDELDRLIETKRKQRFKLLEKELNRYYEDQMTMKRAELATQRILLELERDEKQEELQAVLQELENFRSAREVVNQAILREKQISEQEEFFKILVMESDKNDIEILNEVKNKLSNRESLQKLIWEIFIKRYTNEMIKRVTAGKKICGIYKVTNLKTKESYIGKSVDIGNRWSEHVKSSLSIGTIAHSSFHTRLDKDGVWNYTWEILEETSKDKIGDREKYWIKFYESNKYGLNSKEGG